MPARRPCKRTLVERGSSQRTPLHHKLCTASAALTSWWLLQACLARALLDCHTWCMLSSMHHNNSIVYHCPSTSSLLPTCRTPYNESLLPSLWLTINSVFRRPIPLLYLTGSNWYIAFQSVHTKYFTSHYITSVLKLPKKITDRTTMARTTTNKLCNNAWIWLPK